MKSVLISIRPEWADKILTGEKTMEVRKTRPRLETPFKCYIYATKCRDKIGWLRMRPGHGWQRIDGKIIAEFTCDRIDHMGIPYPAYQDLLDDKYLRESCVPYYTLHRWFGHGGDAYFWHISDLKVYDEPKELETLTALRETKFGYEPNKLKRAPQSWCYVEEP